MDRGRGPRPLLAARGCRRGLGALRGRLLGFHGRGLDVGGLRGVCGHRVPLRALAACGRRGLVLGAGLRVGAGLGLVAQQRRLHRLGAAAAARLLAAGDRHQHLGGHGVRHRPGVLQLLPRARFRSAGAAPGHHQPHAQCGHHPQHGEHHQHHLQQLRRLTGDLQWRAELRLHQQPVRAAHSDFETGAPHPF